MASTSALLDDTPREAAQCRYLVSSCYLIYTTLMQKCIIIDIYLIVLIIQIFKNSCIYHVHMPICSIAHVGNLWQDGILA